ncbi:MAG: helix-turn-helix domain-containing protein [Acidobacteriaceae bacterium]
MIEYVVWSNLHMEQQRKFRENGDAGWPRKATGQMVSNGTIGRRLLNVREAAQYLDLEVDTVYKKSRLREVPSVKVGRALKFDVAALDRYIEQHTIEVID